MYKISINFSKWIKLNIGFFSSLVIFIIILLFSSIYIILIFLNVIFQKTLLDFIFSTALAVASIFVSFYLSFYKKNKFSYEENIKNYWKDLENTLNNIKKIINKLSLKEKDVINWEIINSIFSIIEDFFIINFIDFVFSNKKLASNLTAKIIIKNSERLIEAYLTLKKQIEIFNNKNIDVIKIINNLLIKKESIKSIFTEYIEQIKDEKQIEKILVSIMFINQCLKPFNFIELDNFKKIIEKHFYILLKEQENIKRYIDDCLKHEHNIKNKSIFCSDGAYKILKLIKK